MNLHNSLFIILITIFYYIVSQILCSQCPEIKVLLPFKSRTWIVEGIQIYNSTIRLLRGAQQQGTSEQVSNLMVWDSSTNHCLKLFDLELQINKMFYSKIKRKLFIAGSHKILEIHPLTFKILDEHNVGGITINDIEYSESQILISRDYGNPFIYDIYLKQIVETLPYTYLNLAGIQWSYIATLKDFTLLLVGRLIMFDKNNNYKFLYYDGKSENNYSRACSFQSQNFLVTSNYNDKIQLAYLEKDQQGVTQYILQDEYQEIYQTSSPVDIRAQDLYCVQKGNDNYVIFPIGRRDKSTIIYKGATVLKINEFINSETGLISYKFSIQEKWRYRRWRSDMEFFLFDESAQRGQSISEYEHYSYEFLESDVGQCDFDDDGNIDSYCRMAKTITHWKWNLQMGVLFLGKNQEYFLYGQDKQKGYQIRDWNQTEILRFQLPRLIEKENFSIIRVIQHDKSSYKFPHDTYVLKMCWLYTSFSEMKNGHNSTAGFYIYQHNSFADRKIETYNLINYMNPHENTEKYKNPFVTNSAFTYGSELHICISYTVYEINTNPNSDTINNDLSYQYFSNHNKECYKLKDEKVVNFYQLTLKDPIVYGQGKDQYSKCTPYFEGGQLICRNPKPMLEFWSLDNYSLVKTFDIDGCTEINFFIGCDSSIMTYDAITNKTTNFMNYDNKIPQFIIVVSDILGIFFSNIEIFIYDLRPVDGSTILSLHYFDPQDCCLIYSVDINPVTKKLMWASLVQINYIDLTPCLEDPKNCISCEINAYFSHDPNFSFLKQKQERASWPTAQPQYFVNPKFLDSGLGTIDNPYLMDMNIIQLYYRTNLYKQNFVKFDSITLNIYILINHFIDWTHDKTKVILKPWDGTVNPIDKTGSKIKIVINSAKFFELSFDTWRYLDFSNIIIICPNCKSNTLKFQNSEEVYLRNCIFSLDLKDLIQPSQGESDQRVFPNIRINVSNVDKFVLQNQQIQDIQSDNLNTSPFFTFINCKEVNMKNILFSNITNQESLFESENSSLILESITITKINTCKETNTKRQKFSVIPFQNLIANNITFINNQFCDMSLFQKLVSSNSISGDQIIKISDIKVINNKFDQYINSNILFLKISLASLISSTQTVEINNIGFEKNYGLSKENNNCHYFELNQLQTVFLSQINITDEELVGIGSFNRLQKLEMQSINFVNTQYLPNSSVGENDRKKSVFKQNLIIISDVEELILQNTKIIGLETQGEVTISIEENSKVALKNINVQDCSFSDSLFLSIQNFSNQITSLSITDSNFQDISIKTQESYIQVGILWVRAEKSKTKVMFINNVFKNNYLEVNQNTQKKSSLSFSIDNSISDLTIQDCSFFNKYSSSIIGDLFLNVQSLNIIDSKFNQNLTNLINTKNIPINDTKYIQAILGLQTMKGAFMSIQAQVINMSKCFFSNAISSEGVIQMFPNNNNLNVQLDDCTFSNLYSSITGTAIYLSSITSPASIDIRNCNFNNLWSGSLQKNEKAHLYFEADSLNTNNKNTIKITNLTVYNVGVFSPENPLASNFIYSTGFTLSLASSFIKNSKQLRVLYLDKKLKYYSDFQNDQIHIQRSQLNINKDNQIYEQYPKKQKEISSKNRLLQLNTQTLFEVLKNQILYGSGLIHSILGKIQLDDLVIDGSALINNKYINQVDDILQANILKADKCQVLINNLNITNLKVNTNGGIIVIQDSQLNIFNKFQIENTQIYKNIQQEDFEFTKDIGSAKAFINCIKADCSFSSFKAFCQKNNNKCTGRILNLQEGIFKVYNSLFEDYQVENQNGTAILAVNPKNEFYISKSTFNGLFTHSCGSGIYLFQNNNKSQPILTISENIFEKNYASINGGALSFESLFIQSQEKLNLTNNHFINNNASISGAIYYSNYYFNTQLIKLNKFQNNNAKLANDIFSQPSIISLVFENYNSSDIHIANQTEAIMTIQHGSGLQIPKFIVNLIYIDSQGDQKMADASFLSEQKEILSIDISLDMQNPVKQSNQNSISDYYITGNLQSQYDSDLNQIYFQNVEVYGKEGTIIYLIITSPIIKKIQVYDKQGNVTYEPYRFFIKVIFRECSKFEIITSHSIPLLSQTTKKCQICPDLSYSKNKEICELCPIGAVCKQGEELIVQPGYWRQSYDSFSIIPCQDGFESCIGGQSISNDLCLEGYIGPMCQECDLFDNRGNGKFSHLSKQICRSCSFSYLGFFVILAMLFLSVILAQRSINSNTSFIKGQVIYIKVIQL